MTKAGRQEIIHEVRVGRAEAGELPWLVERKWLRVMEPRTRAAVQAGWEAFAGDTAPPGAGLVVALLDVSWAGLKGARDWKEVSPLWLLSVLPNSVAGHVSRTLGITGPVLTCGTMGEARWVARGWLEDGAADPVLVIGVSPARAEARADWEVMEGQVNGGRQ